MSQLSYMVWLIRHAHIYISSCRFSQLVQKQKRFTEKKNFKTEASHRQLFSSYFSTVGNIKQHNRYGRCQFTRKPFFVFISSWKLNGNHSMTFVLWSFRTFAASVSWSYFQYVFGNLCMAPSFLWGVANFVARNVFLFLQLFSPHARMSEKGQKQIRAGFHFKWKVNKLESIQRKLGM